MGRISALNKTMVRRFSFEYMCKKQVIRFLENGIIDNLGTDLHRASQLESVDKGLTFLKNNFSGYGKDLFSDKFLFENS